MSEISKIVTLEKQYELMYTDAVQVSYETKRAIFDLSKWIVTLHGLIVGFTAVADFQIDMMFLAAPIMIGVVGFILLQGFQNELDSHRRTLATLRARIGGDVAEVHKEHVNKYFYVKNSRKFSYWNLISSGHRLVLLGSTLMSTFITYLSLTSKLN